MNDPYLEQEVMEPAKKQLCFVIMGFGKKTDYSNPQEPPRTLDLDATYEAIIKPAVVAAGLDCIRADEASHSGIIDKVMYEMLLRADLVIADISTGNPNALYELGVRHALKPRTTIVIKEIDGKFIFDLNHLATLQYKHLGDDIGNREAKVKREALTGLILKVLQTQDSDSPVYTFLHNLRQPMLTEAEYQEAVHKAVDLSSTLSKEVNAARAAAAASPTDHQKAAEHFRRALALQKDARLELESNEDADPYLIQQAALHTYKAKTPNAETALLRGWELLQNLHPETSTDPETLGIGGAIQKRLWEATKQRTHLDLAIELYGRGFEIRRDYYNGENYALCLDLRSRVQTDPEEARYDQKTAAKVCARVADSLQQQLADANASDRSDYHWMVASMANVSYALRRADAAKFEELFRSLKDRLEPWMVQTFEDGKQKALKLAAS